MSAACAAGLPAAGAEPRSIPALALEVSGSCHALRRCRPPGLLGFILPVVNGQQRWGF